MKKTKFLGAFIIVFLFSIYSLNTVYGIGATLSSSPSSVIQGNTFTVRVSLSSDVCAANFTVSYNTSKLTLISGETSFAWAEGESLPSYTFKANSGATGSASINLNGTASDTNFVKSNLSGGTNVTITAPVVTPPTTTTPTTTNSNANLKKLVPNYEGLSPNFNSGVTKYSLTVPSTATNLGLTVGVEATGAKYWISGEDNLQMGDNTVTVTVTATDGTKKVYTIIVTKAANVAKANAYLSSIVIDGKTLSPEFTAENLEYDIEKVTSNIEKLTVLAFAQSENAKVNITGNDSLVEGENIIKIIVTAEDGITSKEYKIKVTKDAAEAVQASTNEEVTIYPETNSLQNNSPSGFSNFMHGIWMRLKSVWLILSLLLVCLLELAQIIYLYLKVEKFKKLGTSNIAEDKENLNKEDTILQTRRRNVELENVNNTSWRTDIKKENSNNESSNEIIEDTSDELVDSTVEEKIENEDITDNFEDSIDIEEDDK